MSNIKICDWIEAIPRLSFFLCINGYIVYISSSSNSLCIEKGLHDAMDSPQVQGKEAKQIEWSNLLSNADIHYR